MAMLNRQLKGVMRVGALAKGLLLHGDLNLDLVVLCSDWPTKALVKKIMEVLPKLLSVSSNFFHERDEQIEIKIRKIIVVHVGFICFIDIDDLNR